MVTLIKALKNNRKVVFDSGAFDAWCVYVVENDGRRNAPQDNKYFFDLQVISQKYANNKVYADFVKVYDLTTATIEENILLLIDDIVETYNDEDKILIEQWFSVIYGGMIAEEKKANAILKKRIKRLGMYQTLIQNMNPNDAANYSKGKKVAELSPLMQSYGF